MQLASPCLFPAVVEPGASDRGACSSAFAGWEVHTRGIGSRLLAKMGYEFGKGECVGLLWGGGWVAAAQCGGGGGGGPGPSSSVSPVPTGLGRHSDGRVEPIHAVVLPRGKSLDQCAEILQKRTKGSKAGARRAPECRGRGGRPGGRPPPRSVFDFLNEKLQGQAPGALEAGAAAPGRRSGKELYRASKGARRALSLRLLQTEEKIEQAQRDIRGIQEALARNIGRYVWG